MTNQLFKQALIISFLFCISSQLFKVSAEEFDIEYRDFNCSAKLQSVVLIDSENDNIYTCEDIVSLFPILSDESNYYDIISDTSGNFMLINDWFAAEQTTQSTLIRISNGDPITLWTHTFPGGSYKSLLSPTGTVFNIYPRSFEETSVEEIESVELILSDGVRVIFDSFNDYLPISMSTYPSVYKFNSWSLSGDTFVLHIYQYDSTNLYSNNFFLFFNSEGEIIDMYTYLGSVKVFHLSYSGRYYFLSIKINDRINSFIFDRTSGKSINIEDNVDTLSDVHNGYIYYGNENGVFKIYFDAGNKSENVYEMDNYFQRRLYINDDRIISYNTNINYNNETLSYSYSYLIKSLDMESNIVNEAILKGFLQSQGIANGFIVLSQNHKIVVTTESRMYILYY